MDTTNDIAAFPTSRRAKVTPDQAGLPTYGKRRVPGLRREEVASLAGVSIDYYKRLERGNVSGASDSVLEALARAPTRRRRARSPVRPRPRGESDGGAATAASGTAARPAGRPAHPRLDRDAGPSTQPPRRLPRRQPARALYAPLFESREQPANSARFTFLDPAAVGFYPDWERVANDLVAHLRSEAGRNAYDRRLSDLVGELSTRSAEFRTRWAAHDVRFHRTGTKRIHHPVVGGLSLSYETMELPADAGLNLTVYTAEPGSSAREALDLLASWTATLDQTAAAGVGDDAETHAR